MKIDFTKRILDVDGKPLEERNGDGKVIGQPSFGPLLAAMLTKSSLEEDRGASADQKWARFQLGLKIGQAAGPVEISAEESKLLIEVAGKHPTILIYGRVRELLETGV